MTLRHKNGNLFYFAVIDLIQKNLIFILKIGKQLDSKLTAGDHFVFCLLARFRQLVREVVLLGWVPKQL